MKKMHETPIKDFFAQNGYVREDGRILRAVVPAEQSVQSLAQSTCSLVKIKR